MGEKTSDCCMAETSGCPVGKICYCREDNMFYYPFGENDCLMDENDYPVGEMSNCPMSEVSLVVLARHLIVLLVRMIILWTSCPVLLTFFFPIVVGLEY